MAGAVDEAESSRVQELEGGGGVNWGCASCPDGDSTCVENGGHESGGVEWKWEEA